ncbi:MAG: hypothetical protein GY894_07200 [Planctomycetes bacterium]|jgi:hypothetical protein|nr:hypothetical protein [Planctomycetota bacterium]MCP4839130.1 hypothetical protein [Planctomycetota bacterium]
MPTDSYSIAIAIAKPTRFMHGLAQMLCDDIDPSKFADRLGTFINHSAFVLGHCDYYAGVRVQMLGSDVLFESGEADLYQFGVEHLDYSALYRSKEKYLDHFEQRSANLRRASSNRAIHLYWSSPQKRASMP